jgi:outer membrane receptor protein involved in Fe transport
MLSDLAAFRRFLALLVWTIVITNYSLAQQQESLSDTILVLDDIVVTSNRINTARSKVPHSLSVLSQRELQDHQFRTTPEALMGTPGVFVQKTNHGGGSPFVRGLTGNQTLTLIDGIRLNNPTFRFGPNQYLNTVDPYAIDKIEVLRGSGSVQYGSDAIGGVIQVFSKEPQFDRAKKITSRVLGKMMTNDMEYTGRAEIEFSSTNLAMLLGGTIRNFGDLIGGKETGIQSPTGYRDQNFDSKLKWQKKNILTTFAHQFTRQNKVPVYHKVVLEDYSHYFFDPQIRQLTYLKLESNYASRLFSKIIFTSSLQRSKEVRNFQKNQVLFATEEVDKVQTWGETFEFLSSFSEQWASNTGIEFYRSKVNSLRQQLDGNLTKSRGLYPDDAVTNNFSVYTLHKVTQGRFGLEGGLRYNYFNHRIPNTDPQIADGADISVKPSSLVSNLSALFDAGSGHQLYLAYCEGYRAPNIDDLGTLGLVDFRFEIPAYDLKPEKSQTTELGYKYFGQKSIFNVGAFYTHLTDLITRKIVPGEEVNGYSVYIKENANDSYIRGFEYSVDYYLTRDLIIQHSASYTFGQNISANEPIRRIPPFFGKGLVRYQRKIWSASLEHLFAGPQKRLSSGDIADNRIAQGGTPGWNVLNLYSTVRLNSLSFTIGLQNLFNEDYRLHGSGVNGVGRSGWIAIEIEI